MKRLVLLAALAAAIPLASPAYAQAARASTAPDYWNSPYGGRSVSDRQVDLNEAVAQQQAREGGFGPGSSTTNIGTSNSWSTYNGTVNSSASGATNVNQSSSTTSTLSGSGLTLSVSTGQSMTGNTTQGAASQAVIGNNNAPSATGNN